MCIMCILRLENCSLGDQSGGEIAPQRHHQLACQGDDGDAPDALAGVRRALPEPAAESAVWLMLQPQPGQLDGGMAGASIAGLADPLIAIDAAAEPWACAQPEVAADLPAIAEVLVEDLIHQPAREHQ